ncbi:hypothetical protein PRIPAC_77732 [Pristionchus pacificus]|uniref:Carboxylic ester hydrolase n=1 Tax=Pristionchus pacificus TaxID=54126 RepID=A0A2A6CL60_PRIPA|nr:hypothetical protein PRIPAC_77732 [Pristionchus pacificus]|eukprot:PDM78840.1 hydrolase [Pristionchus pacificus]
MPADYPPSRIVTTSHGNVQGRRLVNAGDRQVDAFQGIPFAAPPIGELRFKVGRLFVPEFDTRSKPQPPSPWDGVRETKKFASRNIQVPFPGLPEDELHGEMSEDCLYLNVFTPCWEAPEGGFPVMVFIHGGAFVFGEASSYGDIGICENIVSRGIVFVTIQYRLGYLGFLSTGDSVCPGNIALWDQTEALRWVQSNIGAFGGSKHNVTLLGQSAGSASVDLLHLSPHSTNLFHKEICMAGTAECRSSTRSCALKHGRAEHPESGDFGRDRLFNKLREIPAEKFAVSLFEAPTPGNRTDFVGNLRNMNAQLVMITVCLTDVTHTNELFYLFKKGFFSDPEITESDSKLIDVFTTALTNFAKYGNPNGSDDSVYNLSVPWKPITKENPALNYVFTSDEPKMSNDLFEGRTAAFIEIHRRHK